MMQIPIYQVDAFTSKVFSGNPAAICLLEDWLEDEILQDIAAENNLSETAFIVPYADRFQIKWFTPQIEIDLCGHATLASAFILFEQEIAKGDQLSFESKSGLLSVKRSQDGMLSLDFPARKPVPCAKPPSLDLALGTPSSATLKSRDLLVILEREAQVKNLAPDMNALLEISQSEDYTGIMVSAQGEEVDFVSRFFAPKVGIPEDPVTGSAHCTLVPYWSEKLNKNRLHTIQLSKRTGELFCENLGDRVIISGKATLYLTGQIYLP